MTFEIHAGERSARRGPVWAWCGRAGALSLGVVAGCGAPAEASDATGASTSATGEPATGEASTAAPTSTGESVTGESVTGGSTEDASTAAPTSGEVSTTTMTGASSTGASTTGEATTGEDGTSTGPAACAKNVVLMGYWPPTNEMMRPWSTNPAQNPEGWVGEDWGGYGYDVYSFFPEFPPDGDPTNDKIGEDGAVGSPDYDLRVDYQATSADFWRIVDTHQPRILLTTSRGGDIGWELEAVEGGHGMKNAGGPAMDWASDGHGADKFPTEATIEARSWDAISMYRKGSTLPSQLPLDEIFAATDALGLTTVAIAPDTSGNFLSGFLALHGLVYNLQAPDNLAAGHIHVGFGLPVADASALLEATLHVVLQQYPADEIDCR